MSKIDWDFTKGNSGARPPRARHHNHLPDFSDLRKDEPMDLLTIAKNAADRVEAASVANKVPVAVCGIDIHGNVVLQHRMTGGPVFSIELSERKAYPSALVGMRTADILPLVQP